MSYESTHTNHTARAKMDSGDSKCKVFATTELLEGILLQLPPEDLLLAQRVNR